MSNEEVYKPIQMYHPHHEPAVLSTDKIVNGIRYNGGASKAEKFPNVHVNSQDEEDYYRAQGYLALGESPEMSEGTEYPKWVEKDGAKKIVANEAEEAAFLGIPAAVESASEIPDESEIMDESE